MRILQIVHGFPPQEFAGAELVTFSLSQALRARGHQVTVFTRIADAEAAEFSVREEQTNGFSIVRMINNHIQTSTALRFAYDNSFCDAPFLHLLDRFRPDVVHFQHLAHLSVSLIPLAASLGYPIVLSLHDFFFPCHRNHLIDAQNRLCSGPDRGERCVPCLEGFDTPEEIRRRFAYMEQTMQVPDAVLSPSVFLAEKMLDYFPLLRRRLHIVPLGVKPVRARARHSRPGMPLRILYVGYLFPPKGAHVLIEAIKGLPLGTFEVSLYGASSSLWQSYSEQVRAAAQGLPVRFYSPYAHDQLSSILSSHDVLVMPGICEETFSIITREALMAGLAVVAARRGALPEAIQDGVNGLLFAPGNAADLCRCLARLIAEPEFLERLRNGDASVKTPEEYAEEMETIYTELCTAPSRVRSLQEHLREWYQRHTALSQTHERLQAEVSTLYIQTAALQTERDHLYDERFLTEQERDLALTTVQELRNTLELHENAIRERDARLAAIYTSTTWKAYRCYAAFMDFCARSPLGRLKQWLVQ
jgi:glycosyltransferase involved in cell wall biosynthesis